MRLISIQVSPHQLRRLKKGHKIRIRKGTGCNLVVNPQTYNLMSRAFRKDKGAQVKLSNEELEQNRKASEEPKLMEEIANTTEAEEGERPEMAGMGIFSKLKKGLKKAAPILKPLAKEGLKMMAPRISKKLESKPALSKLANFGMSKAQEALGKGLGKDKLASPYVHGLTHDTTKKVAESNRQLASMTDEAIKNRIKQQYPSYEELSEQPFAPFSRGYGLSGCGHAIVGRGGGMVGYGHPFTPPALVSQPYSANYQMSHFLPPHFQHYNNSMHLHDNGSGKGLYAGRGLYSGSGMFA